ncbi:LytTR family DNA-binding domain-containing protein [Roseivirga sp. E12]|uniref:LytR/AlgR family response regulator transcription factor n=1 Tax=Roseivirga sp. E12 TaxID=2819237 RepID=UPI001ABC7097|nr:response regulator [Roseivirga sp. E12]MBO3697348.1 response regulator [Roseivirga sp. E12]
MSSKITVLVADDEPVARQVILHFLHEEEDFEVIAECGDGRDALEKIEDLKPQLVFLDIEMPEISGIELISQLSAPLPTIVFVTAYNKYAVQAFEENALDYILKPFDANRFGKALDRIKEKFNEKINSESKSLDDLLNIFEGILAKNGDSKYLKKIGCKHRGVIKFIPVEDIVWVESEGAFCKLHLANNMEITNLSIKQLETLIDPNTHLRIHKSHMVNIDKIESIEPYFHGEYMVNLKGGKTLKLSRGFKERLELILNQYK